MKCTHLPTMSLYGKEKTTAESKYGRPALNSKLKYGLTDSPQSN
jgi:hypothetical protein